MSRKFASRLFIRQKNVTLRLIVNIMLRCEKFTGFTTCFSFFSVSVYTSSTRRSARICNIKESFCWQIGYSWCFQGVIFRNFRFLKSNMGKTGKTLGKTRDNIRHNNFRQNWFFFIVFKIQRELILKTCNFYHTLIMPVTRCGANFKAYSQFVDTHI